jgi:peroxiredoxin
MPGYSVQSFDGLMVGKRLALVPMALVLLVGSLLAQERETFSHILTQQTAKTFELTQRYLNENPDAPDREAAYEWLLETARDQGWEAKILSIATDYLKPTGEEVPNKNLAQQVRMVGLAKSGQWDDALIDFERQLAGTRLRMPTEIVALAKTLVFEAQAAGKPDTAKDIYRNLSRQFFLNPEVKQLCETKLAKLDLIGNPAPDLGVKDLAGQDIKLDQFKERWILLDFWATNCPPCIKDLPELKRLYETHHASGLEVIGISLDEDVEVVREFQKSRKIPWGLALSQTDNDQTREKYHVPTIPSMVLINPQGEVDLIDPTLRDLDRYLQSHLDALKKPEGENGR